MKKAAIMGWWYNQNYGSILTYYALNKFVKDQGYETLMIDGPLGYKQRSNFRGWMPLAYSFFAKKGMPYTEQLHKDNLTSLNDIDGLDTFVLGSDQMWNPWNGWVDEDDFFDFVYPRNKKIAYSVSLGKDDTSKYDSKWVQNRKKDIEQFDSVAMREDFSVRIMNDIFNEQVIQAVDPTYLIDIEDYEKIADDATFVSKSEDDYIAVFFLDINSDKVRVAKEISKKLGLRLIVLPNPLNGRAQAQSLFNEGTEEFLVDDIPENFLKIYQNSKYIITDSFHGTVFATIFNKPFSVFYNEKRGADRFNSLMNLFEFGESRRVRETDSNEDVINNSDITIDIDYEKTKDKLSSEKEKSMKWLKEALENNKIVDDEEVYDDYRDKLVNKSLSLFSENNGEPISLGIILSPNGTIKNSNPEESFWKLTETHLIFLDSNRNETIRFERTEINDQDGINLEGIYNNRGIEGKYSLVEHNVEAYNFLISKKFEFGLVEGDIIFNKEWRFGKNGLISGYVNTNEYSWRIVKDKLYIYSELGNVSAIYDLSGDYKRGLKSEVNEQRPTQFFLRTRKPYDIIQVKILVSTLKMQGIKHIVASSGSRDVSILRLIEKNSDFFKVYPLGDERSAAYFAHGLATRLKEPVALVCTSGTAASNYLPGVTEAYYSNTPLIVITADRHPMYLNNREDQTVPQARMFDGVVKKEVSLLAGEHPRFEWFTEKEIKSTILEATHGTPGPVHINIPVLTFEGLEPEDEDFTLKRIQPVRRITLNDSNKTWNDYINVLKNSKRIMLLMGQNQPMTEEQKEKVFAFARKYNVVIISEHLSNFQGEHTVNPYRLLGQLSQGQYNQMLKPEILISVGGTQIMNHPITNKLRQSPGLRHWMVEESGDYYDKFYHLTSILECSQDKFFDYFVENAGDISNDEQYYNAWKDKVNVVPLWTQGADRYTQFDLEGKLITNLPKNSMLHLGVGNTFMMTQNFALDPSIEVQVNMGTNGIDGSVSTFMGQVATMPEEQLAFLLIGDLSFFYDMNGIWNKNMSKNIRIMLINNGKAGLLEYHQVESITQKFDTKAEGWVKDLGFEYLSSHNLDEYKDNLNQFISKDSDKPIFFEVFI